MRRATGYPDAEIPRIDDPVNDIALKVAEKTLDLRGGRKQVSLRDSERPAMRMAEIAGGKTAECAAIFCCCPCGLANLFFLAVVRFPAGLCRQAVRKRIRKRRAKKKAELLGSGSDGGSGSSKGGSSTDDEIPDFAEIRESIMMVFGDRWPARSPAAEVMELEKEMSKFHGSGFWRSVSQKDVR